MAELRSRSSRANITRTSFVNHYEWGNFKGDPIDWMRRYFDVHVYVTNGCICLLYLWTPREAFDGQTVRAHATDSVLTVENTNTHWILKWTLQGNENHDRFGIGDGEGWMGRSTPLRDELLRGDLRPLYLGWPAGVSAGEVDEDAVAPPPPPGLSRLTAAQQSLAEFLEIDPDLLTAAALPDQSPYFSAWADEELEAWVVELSAAEQAAAIKLLMTGHAQEAERQLCLCFLAWKREQRPIGAPEQQRRTVAELQKVAMSAAETRTQQETFRRNKADEERLAEREVYLRTLAADFDRCWQAADERAERGIAFVYDEVKRALVDLAEDYTLCASRADFDLKLAGFMARHGKCGALAKRLSDAKLWKKS